MELEAGMGVLTELSRSRRILTAPFRDLMAIPVPPGMVTERRFISISGRG